MSFGIDVSGFNRKTFNDLIVEAENRAKSLYGPDIQLSENSFFGLLLQLYIFFQDESWQLAEQVYNGAYVDTATGVQLDAAVKYAQITRNQATKAVGVETFNGVDGTFIPVGTLIASGDIQFETLADITIVGGTTDVSIRAIDLGSGGNVTSNTIITLVNPIAGVTSITNANPTIDGQDEETDPQLRSRYYQTLQISGKSTVDAIRSDILSVSGVRAVTLIENDTDAIVGSIPPHHFESIIDGGSDTAVAEAILSSKAFGIGTYGTISVIVQDSAGVYRTINFSRPVIVDIWVNVDITKDLNYPVDGDTQIQTLIVDFINALIIGSSVIVSKLSSETFKVAGVIDSHVEVSIDGIIFNTNNIIIGSGEKAQTNSIKVVVVSV